MMITDRFGPCCVFSATRLQSLQIIDYKAININCFYTKKEEDIFTGEHVQCNANEMFGHLIS